MEKNYIRCEKCGFVYEEVKDNCPRCNEPKTIAEDLNEEYTGPVFNICDGE